MEVSYCFIVELAPNLIVKFLKMKKIITVLMLTFISWSNLVNAQAPNWQWAKSVGGSYSDNTGGVAVDGNGNSYVTGSFRGTTITIGSTILTNADNTGNTDDIHIMNFI